MSSAEIVTQHANMTSAKQSPTLGLSDMSTLVLPPREREKRDRRISRGDEREEQGRKSYRNES